MRRCLTFYCCLSLQKWTSRNLIRAVAGRCSLPEACLASKNLTQTFVSKSVALTSGSVSKSVTLTSGSLYEMVQHRITDQYRTSGQV